MDEMERYLCEGKKLKDRTKNWIPFDPIITLEYAHKCKQDQQQQQYKQQQQTFQIFKIWQNKKWE